MTILPLKAQNSWLLFGDLEHAFANKLIILARRTLLEFPPRSRPISLVVQI